MANHDPEAFEAAARGVRFFGFCSIRARVSSMSTSASRISGAIASLCGRRRSPPKPRRRGRYWPKAAP
ncbi:hypothetical protein [Roseovarius sp.]|uniref:hypothetical protein n=1 Tax=Roseovarius sp. TaxID=1486281 RepID=UPI00356B0938